MNSVGIWPPRATGRTVVVSAPNPVIDSLLGLVQSLLRASLREGKRLSGYQMPEVQVNKADGEHDADFIRSILRSCALQSLL